MSTAIAVASLPSLAAYSPSSVQTLAGHALYTQPSAHRDPAESAAPVSTPVRPSDDGRRNTPLQAAGLVSTPSRQDIASSSEQSLRDAIDDLKQQLRQKDQALNAKSQMFVREQQEMCDIVKLNQDELAAARRSVESLKRELHAVQEREQLAVAEIDAATAVQETLQKDLNAAQAEIDRLQQSLRKRGDDSKRLEEACLHRAKELSIATIGRSRCEKKCSALQHDLDELEERFAALQETHQATLLVLRTQSDQLDHERAAHFEAANQLQQALAQSKAEFSVAKESQSLSDERAAKLEEQVAALVLEVGQQRDLLRQCDETMTSLDEENKVLQDSNAALRANGDRLGEAVQGYSSKLQLLADNVTELSEDKQRLANALKLAEDTIATMVSELDAVRPKLDIALDELDAERERFESERRRHIDTIAELQRAGLTAKRAAEEQLEQSAAAIRDLHRQCEVLKSTLDAERTESARRLLQAVSEKEVELLRDAAASRHQLIAELHRAAESDPRLLTYDDTRRQLHDALNYLDYQRHHLHRALSVTLPEEECSRRCELEEYALYLLNVLSITALEIPQTYEDQINLLRANAATLQAQAEHLVDSLDVATQELVDARRDAAAANLPHVQRVVGAHRKTFVRLLADLSLRSRLMRRRLRALFSLGSWKTLVDEQLIPDDFGQSLCEIVDDIQCLHDRHRDLAELCLLPEEREEWGIPPSTPPPSSAAQSDYVEKSSARTQSTSPQTQ